MKKIISFALILVLNFSCLFYMGCFLNEQVSDPVSINIVVCEGSTDVNYYRGAASRFMQSVDNKNYIGQHTGVSVGVAICDKPSYKIENQGYLGYDIYVTTDSFGYYVKDWVKRGYITNLTDVVMEKSDLVNGKSVSIEEKIDNSAISAYQSDYYEYYALPSTSEIVGLTYDGNAFNKYGYYFAKDEKDAIPFYSEITKSTYYFVKGCTNSVVSPINKSAGPDGIYNTVDDGAPSTLFEFVALCEYIKSHDRYPFIASGEDVYKADYLVQALTYSLMGYEQARACMDLTGEIDVVTGFSNELLFTGLDPEIGAIYKPITKKIQLTEECGFYASWAVAKYYAECFLDLSLKLDWWASCSYKTNATTEKAIKDFVFSGYDLNIEQSLMLCESSSWYEVLKDENYLSKYNKTYNWDGREKRILNWMSLPTLLDGKEEDASKRKTQTYLQVHPTYLVLADEVRYDAAKMEACKEFLKFLCTEQECNFYTLETGMRKDFKYDYVMTDLYEVSNYYATLEENLYHGDVIYLASNTPTFKKHPEFFEGGKRDSRFYYYEKKIPGDSTPVYVVTTAFEYFRDFYKSNVQHCFLNRLIDKGGWSKYYGGYSTITEYIDSNGNPVVFNK